MPPILTGFGGFLLPISVKEKLSGKKNYGMIPSSKK